MESILNTQNLKLFILKAPFQNWQNPVVQEWFCKMLALKKKGYDACYDGDILPVDTTDFFATHIILATKDAHKGYQPIMGYKITSFNDAQRLNLVFPGMALAQAALAVEHVLELEKIIQRCVHTDRSLYYLGSWTTHPHFKKILSLRQTSIREIFSYLYSKVFLSLGTQEVIIGGTLRFKTDELFSRLGHEPLKNRTGVLPPIFVQHLAKEPVLIMHSKKVPEVSKMAELEWRSLWRDRTEIGSSQAVCLIKRSS